MKKIKIKKLLVLFKNKNLVLLIGLTFFWWSFLSNAEIGKSNFFHDQDQDGLTDKEENMYGTDPNNADSDNDGYRDGVEVEGGFDPLKPAPGDKLFSENTFKTEEQTFSTKPNLTEEFMEKIKTEKKSEIDLLNNYYNNPEEFSEDQEKINSLGNTSLTSGELQELINQTLNGSSSTEEMVLISEDQIKIIDKPSGKEDKIKEKEQEQIKKYLTQILYVMSVNKPFSVVDENLLSQIGVDYINQISGGIQQGQTAEITELKESAEKTLEELLEIETPHKTKDIHIRMISLIKYLTININTEKIIDQKDPMTMALYVGKFQAAISEMELIKAEIEELVDEYEIDVFENNSLDEIF